MKDILIKNANIMDVGSPYHKQIVDIFVKDGLIHEIGRNLNKPCELFNAEGYFVSPGFIDCHVHCYHDKTVIGIIPQDIGVKTGVTTLIDAGTSGADTIKDFYDRIIKSAHERVFVLLNTATEGLKTLSELSSEDAINEDKIHKAVSEYKDLIVGLKARASQSVLKTQGIGPIIKSKAIAEKLNLPLVIHIGNAPPKIEEVLGIVNRNDVITHCYHNKPNGLFDEVGYAKDDLTLALKRGVKFDVGHGSSSFSFDIFDKALKHGFKHDFIGSDIYDKNIHTVVKSLVNVMNKVFVGHTCPEEVVSMVTNNPATHFKLDRLGFIKKGYYGDFTLFKLNKTSKTFEDSVGQSKTSTCWIEAKFAIVSGQVYRTENGGNQ